MKKYLYLSQLLIVFLLATNFAQSDSLVAPDIQPAANQDILLESISWVSIPIQCLAGDIISGELSITNNGNLFIGDQTKYDNWLLDGIDFLIFDAENYDLWNNDLAANSFYEKKGIFELSWNIKVPSGGIWYLVYVNDSIFMKQIQTSIQHVSPICTIFTLSVTVLVSLTALISSYLLVRKKK